VAPEAAAARPGPAPGAAPGPAPGRAASGSPPGSAAAAGGPSPLVAFPGGPSGQGETVLQSAVSDGLEALPIEPRDASEWWRGAAARWHEIVAGLRGEAAARNLAVAASPPVSKQRRLQEAPWSPRDSVAVSAVMPKRPPATPCSAEPSKQRQEQQQLQQQCQEMVTGLEVSTPRSSPRAMRINSRAEACEICCNDAPPWRAVRLGCGHGWYCAQCILRHAEARLEVGAASVTCPECSSPLAERDLRKLLPPELIDRLLARSLEQAISSAADLWACPTPNCPMRVALGDGEVPRLRCTLCKKDSCLRCSAQPYHRGMTCEEYAARRRLKGKRQQRDEDSFMQWLKETGTKQCPTCRMGVTKQNLQNQQTQRSECHKMFCRNCNTRFCFKCLAVLTDSYTCGCTIDAHGFINPRTGRRLNHLRRGRVGAKGKGPGNR